MKVGDIVVLSEQGKERLDYIECPYGDWIFIVTGMSEDGLDYYIDNLYWEENRIGIHTGEGSIVIEDDVIIKTQEFNNEKLVNYLHIQYLKEEF